MPDAGSLMRRAVLVACLVAASVRVAGAQSTDPAPAPDFLTRYAFHLEAAHLSTDDVRFAWDTHFGGDIDAIDYGVGRLALSADYNAVLGTEYRDFDPNQGNYTLEAAATARLHGPEVALVFHHVSRHLSDRPKRYGIDWNVLGARVLGRAGAGPWRLDAQAGVGRVIKHDYVDYSWTADGRARASRQVNARVGVFATGSLEVFGVDPALYGLDTQTGGRLEAGIRLLGHGGALELFAAYERRVDAFPVDRVPLSWSQFGFRIVNK